MFSRPLFSRLTAWLALWVVLCSALAPLVAQAMVGQSARTGSFEVCTATGMVRVLADAADAPSGGESDSRSLPAQPCPVCHLHGAWGALPAADAAAFQPLHLGDMPPAFYRAATLSAVWRKAQSRGPPQV